MTAQIVSKFRFIHSFKVVKCVDDYATYDVDAEKRSEPHNGIYKEL